MKDTQNNGRSKPAMSGGRRLAWGAGIGVLLFAIGYGMNAKGWLSFSLGLPDNGTTQLGEATYSREAMEADRKAQSKDKHSVTAGMPVGADGYYVPPPESSIPDTPYGEAVRRGQKIFMETSTTVSDHVGNTLACVNCHLDGGRREHSAPMWGGVCQLSGLSFQDQGDQHAGRSHYWLFYLFHECAGFVLGRCTARWERCVS